MKLSATLFLTVIAVTSQKATSFGISSGCSSRNLSFTSSLAQYGPSDDQISLNEIEPTSEQRASFESVFRQVMDCEVREHLPSIVSSNIDLLIDLRGDAGVNLFHEQVSSVEATGNEELIQRAHAAVEYIVYFIEAFVGEAKIMDDNNKMLLGKILKCMTAEDDGSLSKQEMLNELMISEKSNFTPGFLRYLEGECTRIANAQNMDVETARLLEVMRTIQARVIEELGQDLGEGAQVLGQLLGYESGEERIAVLDAGLQVRGVVFAMELKAMTEEALVGFQNVPGGVDPGLQAIVLEMDSRIQEFIHYNSA